MNRQSARFAGLVVLAVAAMGVSEAAASATYIYTGKPYTYTYPSPGCLTTGMHLKMTVVLSAALAPNLVSQTVPAVSWVINDGLHHFKDKAAKAVVPLRAQFSTDGNGKITAWSVDSYYYTPDGINVLYTTHSTKSGDYSADYNCTPSDIASNFVPGKWKLQ